MRLKKEAKSKKSVKTYFSFSIIPNKYLQPIIEASMDKRTSFGNGQVWNQSQLTGKNIIIDFVLESFK